MAECTLTQCPPKSSHHPCLHINETNLPIFDRNGPKSRRRVNSPFLLVQLLSSINIKIFLPFNFLLFIVSREMNWNQYLLKIWLAVSLNKIVVVAMVRRAFISPLEVYVRTPTGMYVSVGRLLVSFLRVCSHVHKLFGIVSQFLNITTLVLWAGCCKCLYWLQ